MIITPPQTGAREQIIGNYFVSSNEWAFDQTLVTCHGLNLKGLVAYLDLYAITNAPGKDPGVCCAIPSSTGGAGPVQQDSYVAPIGILIDDMILGPGGLANIVNCWVRVLHFGYCDRIMTNDVNAVDTNDTILFAFSTVSGFVHGCSATEYRADPVLSGILNLDTGAAGPVAITFDGTDTPGADWFASPTVIVPTGLADRRSTFIGWHYRGDAPKLIPEVASGKVSEAAFLDVRQVRGFISCMGYQHTR